MKKARKYWVFAHKRKIRAILFLATALAGMILGAVIIGITIYQLTNLNQLINESQQNGVTLDAGALSHAETNYAIIIVAATPLTVLSLILMHRSLRRLKTEVVR